MDYLLLPDFIAMALLVSVLLMMRGKRGESPIALWSAGLLLILLECAARILYGVRLPLPLHRAMHVVALDAYLIAGALFLRSASDRLRRMPRSRLFLWSNIAPHLLLLSVYGAEIHVAWIYRALVLAGIVTGVVSCAVLRRSWTFYAAFAVIWTPLLICTTMQQYRAAIYISLFFLYALSAIAFGRSLPRGSRGKIAVVTGFAMWALCFATHPWIADMHPDWVPFANELWNMQKFIITVGLLITMLEKQLRSNEWLALHDELTGLPNRRLFDDRLQYALRSAERDSHRVAFFVLDLDGFKQVNDTLGHDAGDELLRRVTQNLEKATRRSDTLARLGGDEFSLIAVDLGGRVGNFSVERPAAVEHAAGSAEAHPMHLPQTERIRNAMLRAVEQPIMLSAGAQTQTIQVSASIGVAVFPDDGRDGQALLRLADQRMYQQKELRASRARIAAEQVSPMQTTQRA